MSGVERLFLGGPHHGRRHTVTEGSYSYVVPTIPQVGFFLAEADDLDLPVDESRVVYTLKRVPGHPPVFVAPDFTWDAPEWLAFDTEAWAAAMVPGMVGWEHLGAWRWRARHPEDAGYWLQTQWLYVLLADRADGFVKQLVSDYMVEDALYPVDEVVFGDMQHEIDDHRLPTCVVPDCTEKAPMVFTADEAGRLAGRQWRKGDEIRLCPPHGSDVYRSAGVYDVDQVAEWLRPDVMLPADPWSLEAALHWGAGSQLRTLRVAIPMKETG